MALLFNGDPVAGLGTWDGTLHWAHPPWDHGPSIAAAGVSGVFTANRNAQIQILQDGGARFPGQKYWRFEVAPGDAIPNQSGERVLINRPQYWTEENQRIPEELDGLPTTFTTNHPSGRTGSPPWGTIRYYGMSVKLDSSFRVPHSFCLFLQQKMSTFVVSPWMSLCVRCDIDDPQGTYVHGATGPLRIFLEADLRRTTGSNTPVVNRRPTAPNVDVVTNQWYDFIWAVKYAFDNTGFARMWWKTATASSWNFLSVFENGPCGQYDVDASDETVYFTRLTQGLYRQTSSLTHIAYQTGFYAATTFDDIAVGIYGAGGSPPTSTAVKPERRTRTRRTSTRVTRFDGVDDQIKCGLGSTLQSYGTTVAIVQPSPDAAGLQHVFGWYDSMDAGHAAPLQWDVTTGQLRYFNGNTAARSVAQSIPNFAGSPTVIATRKNTGAAFPRFSWMPYYTRLWGHEDAIITIADHSVAGGASGITITKLTPTVDILPAATTHTTESNTYTAGRLYVVIVFGTKDPIGPAPTLSGASQTWTEIRNDLHDVSRRRLTSFRCLPSSTTSGALTIDWAGNSTTASWCVLEITGMDTTGTNGSGAIGDTDASSGTGTTGSVTALTLTDANSVNLAFFMHRANEATTHEATWTELFDRAEATNYGFQGEYKVNDTTATATWTTNSNWGGQALELKATTGGVAPSYVVFGEHISGTTNARLDGDLLACAWFGGKVLTDQQIEGMADPASWLRHSPTGMWIFDKERVYDISHGGANETDRIGTTVIGSPLPSQITNFIPPIYLPATHRGQGRSFRKMIETSTTPNPAPAQDFLLFQS